GERRKGEIGDEKSDRREAVSEHHATDVITGLTEIREAANRAAQQHAIRPSAEEPSLLAKRAAAVEAGAQRIAEGWTRRHGFQRIVSEPDVGLHGCSCCVWFGAVTALRARRGDSSRGLPRWSYRQRPRPGRSLSRKGGSCPRRARRATQRWLARALPIVSNCRRSCRCCPCSRRCSTSDPDCR